MANNSLSLNTCAPAAFPFPSLLGAELLSLEAVPITNYTLPVATGLRIAMPSKGLYTANFCNITVSYTHPGQNDIIHVEAWLPSDDWNGRLNALGGGGFSAGRHEILYAGMIGAVADGYATVTTDAGLVNGTELDFTPWILNSPGNINLYALQNFGSVSLNDEAVIVKSLIKSYYGEEPSYSYWTGCSQGGRQGAMLAQRYASAYDGIIAAAPAVNWAGVMISTVWPTVYMDQTGQYPYACELDELTSLAVLECDSLDGVEDGVIADPDACKLKFDPFAHVGTLFNCSTTGAIQNLSTAAAAVANAAWTGPVTAANESTYLYGLNIGTNLTKVVLTACTEDGKCISPGSELVAMAIRYFVEKNPASNKTTVTLEELERAHHLLAQELESTMGTNSPNLQDFRDAGGKMITFHGMADQTVPTNNSLDYYKEVIKFQPDAQNFYRYYLVPGLEHCFGGSFSQPDTLFEQLRSWVENGTAPESAPVTLTKPDNTTEERIVCPYPKTAVLDANKTESSSGWSCEE